MTDEEYKAWCSHFDDRPKTTDDCYTPRQVIDFVEDYFCDYYNIDRSKIIRPFYPGGDFEHEDYTDKVVLDNPPFSLLTKIVQFYQKNGVKFVLYCNGTTGTTKMHGLLTYHIGGTVIYENGARVNTAFVTNMNETEAIVSDRNFSDKLEKLTNKCTRQKCQYEIDEITLATVKKCDWVLLKSEIIEDIHKTRKDAFGIGYKITKEAGIRRNEAEKEAGYAARN